MICIYSPAFGQNNYYIGFENDSDALFFNISPTNGRIENSVLKMTISPSHPSSVHACVCGGPGTIDFKWKQPSTIADFVFYANGSHDHWTFQRSEKLTSSGSYSIDAGPHLLTWEYKFRPNCGIALPAESLESTSWVDDIHLNGLRFCGQNTLGPSSPEMQSVVGPRTTQIGVLCNYSALAASVNPVRYFFDWGDGVKNETDLINPGSLSIKSHIWKRPGTYKLMVIAKDNNNKSSVPFNMTIYVSCRESSVTYPGNDLNDIINKSKYTIFSLAEGFYDKSIYIVDIVNNITIKSEGNNYATVIDSSNKEYCIRIYNTTNINIENLVLRNGHNGIIIEKSKNIKIIRNKIMGFKTSGIRIINCSNITIDSNIFNSNEGKIGISIMCSNTTNSNYIISKNNTITSDKFCISLNRSRGNHLYTDNNCRNFKEDSVECTLVNNKFFECTDRLSKDSFSADYNNISQYLYNFYKENK